MQIQLAKWIRDDAPDRDQRLLQVFRALLNSLACCRPEWYLLPCVGLRPPIALPAKWQLSNIQKIIGTAEPVQGDETSAPGA